MSCCLVYWGGRAATNQLGVRDLATPTNRPPATWCTGGLQGSGDDQQSAGLNPNNTLQIWFAWCSRGGDHTTRDEGTSCVAPLAPKQNKTQLTCVFFALATARRSGGMRTSRRNGLRKASQQYLHLPCTPAPGSRPWWMQAPAWCMWRSRRTTSAMKAPGNRLSVD